MVSVDLKKTYSDYTARRTPTSVDIPARPYLMVDGAGDPNTSAEFQDAVEALYPIAYAMRAAIKEATGDAYTVMPLEGLWWVPDMARFDPADKGAWLWTAMICLPDASSEAMAADLIPTVTAKKALVAGSRVRYELFSEGPAAQILHIGPYSEETEAIQALHDFIDRRGHTKAGRHHEIYLSDARRTAPEKLRTIIRQPFAP